jgi:alkylation response protein AidB-like acyl-CoA dehydrogenase
MTQTSRIIEAEPAAPGLRAPAEALLPALAEGAAAADAADRFVADSYARLRDAGLVEAGVPRELGGKGAEVAELADMLRVLAHACGSTALAFSMHTHQVAVPAWRWTYRQVAAVEPLLRRVAAERIILVSSGGSDWIGGSGTARRVDGGYRISARKVFASGAPAGDILMTGAILEEDGERTVLHFGAPMKAAEVRIEETWRTLGMRGTGSHDVVIDDLFVPEAAVALKRRAGEWHPAFQIIGTVALPLIYAVYLGVAESARDLAVELAKKRKPGPHTLSLAGRMDRELRAAQLAHRAMVAAAERNDPSAESVNEVMIGRSLVAEHAIRTVALAMELAGGAGFYRAAGLERRFRDVQGARYHPLQQGPQAEYAGAMALGLPVATIY